MTLVVFDLDGTLLHSNRFDNDCYVRALHSVIGVEITDRNWARFPDVTDTGVTDHIFRDHAGRASTLADLAAVADAMLVELARHGEQGERIDVIAGAESALRHLRERGVATALATGAWRSSADWKLAHAGLDLGDMPAAHADDGVSRESIVETAIRRAESHHDRSFERVISVGDAVWDVETARTLGLPFIGIAEGARVGRLAAAGAPHVLPHYEPIADFLTLVASLS